MYKILVIEDDYLICDNIRELLELNDYQVQSSYGGKVGIELAKTFLPDVVLCDRMMGDIDGFNVLNALRAHPETAHIPFVFLTAMADRESIRQGMDAGADDYVVKPFSTDELLETVNVWLNYKHSLNASH